MWTIRAVPAPEGQKEWELAARALGSFVYGNTARVLHSQWQEVGLIDIWPRACCGVKAALQTVPLHWGTHAELPGT